MVVFPFIHTSIPLEFSPRSPYSRVSLGLASIPVSWSLPWSLSSIGLLPIVGG